MKNNMEIQDSKRVHNATKQGGLSPVYSLLFSIHAASPLDARLGFLSLCWDDVVLLGFVSVVCVGLCAIRGAIGEYDGDGERSR